MSSTLSAEQFVSSMGAKDGFHSHNSTITEASMKSGDLKDFIFSIPATLGRTISQSSIQSEASGASLFGPSSNNSSLATTPDESFKEDAKFSDSSYFPDATTLKPELAPCYQVSSISSPTPPLPEYRRPLTKAEAKKEAAYHAKIVLVYQSARSYENRIAKDPMTGRSYEPVLNDFKKELWEYRMAEIFPPTPPPMPESKLKLECKSASGWKSGEPVQVGVGILILLLAMVIPFSLFGQSA